MQSSNLRVKTFNYKESNQNSRLQGLNCQTKGQDEWFKQEVEKIPDSKSPDPPMSPLTPMSPLVQKECPICMGFMIEPCRLPEDPCEHCMCLDCMKLMFHKGSSDVFKFNKEERKVCVKCPICRAYAFADLNQNMDELIHIDHQHQDLLKNAFNYEYRANLDPEYKEEIQQHHEEQYLECIHKMQENCPLTFELGMRELPPRKDGVKQWQEFVRLKNPEYQQIIDKILWRVDFCINSTNLNGIKDPLVHMTSDHLFRSQKRNFIKNKQAPEIAMQPMGGPRSCLTQMPEFLPVKLYFNQIDGICCTVREVVHDDLKSGKNELMEFRVIASKKALNRLLIE